MEAREARESNESNKTHVSVFFRTLQLSEAWVQEVQEIVPGVDADSAYHLLRAVLHAIRDRLPTEEVAHFASELPMLLRGSFYENWVPNGMSRDLKAHFPEDVFRRLDLIHASIDLEPTIHKIFQVVARHISPGEMRDVLGTFPRAAREFLAGDLPQAKSA